MIRLLFLYRKEGEAVTSTEVDSQPVLYSEVSGTIALLRERFDVVRRSEIHRVRGRLGNLSCDQDVVESLSRGIIEKVLQAPLAMLLNAAAANQVCLYRQDGAQDFQSANVRLLFRASPSAQDACSQQRVNR